MFLSKRQTKAKQDKESADTHMSLQNSPDKVPTPNLITSLL